MWVFLKPCSPRRRVAVETAVEVRGVEKSFGHIRAVAGANLSLHRGEIYGLVGPSGAGKTTLIRMICGLLRWDAGDIRVLGHPMPEGKRRVAGRIGYMPQERALYRDLSVAENLAFFGQLQGMKKEKIRQRTEEILSFMRLAPLSAQLAGNLSGGEKQRLSLACALLHRPELLILDEPTVGLDPRLRQEFWEHFHELREAGHTILLTTHYLEEAGRCTRVGFMRAGRIRVEGTPEELQAQVSEIHGGTPSMEDVFLLLTEEER